MGRGHSPETMEALREIKALQAEYDETGNVDCLNELDDWRDIAQSRISIDHSPIDWGDDSN